jgi:hypothetical protein
VISSAASGGFQAFIGFDGADVVPLAFVDNDAPDRSRLFYDPSDKNGNDGFAFSDFQETEKRSLYGIDAGEEAALNARISQGVPEVADFTAPINIYVHKGAVASKGKRHLRSHFFMGFKEPLQGKVGHHVPVVAEDGLVLIQEIFNVF